VQKLEQTIFNFTKKLAYSQGRRLQTDLDTLSVLIDGCIDIRKTDTATDKNGIDYIAKLRGGTSIGIDAKTREPGCSEYWKYNEPELAPEIWSVMPGGKYGIPRERAKCGWTLDESKTTDYVFCTFDPVDTDHCYLLPFQLYRMAFRRNVRVWRENYKAAIQDSGTWQSMCVFVPVHIVLDAIRCEMEAYKKLEQMELFDA